MRVSLIMTTYNSRETFRQSLASALSQDYPDLELVIKDGGSTDGTLELSRESAAKHDNIVWKSCPDTGIYDGMNQGIEMSSGDVIAVFNDLFTCTDAVSKLARPLAGAGSTDHNGTDDSTAGSNPDSDPGSEIASNPAPDITSDAAPDTSEVGSVPEYDGVHSDLAYMQGDHVVRRWKMGEGKITDGWMPAHPTLYLRREVYEKYGLYDTSYWTSADYEFMVRILGKNQVKLAYVPEELIHMFYGGTSNGGFKGYLRNTREAYKALKANEMPHPAEIILKRILKTLKQFRS